MVRALGEGLKVRSPTIRVRPSFWQSSQRTSWIPSAVLESKFPVGSSARIFPACSSGLGRPPLVAVLRRKVLPAYGLSDFPSPRDAVISRLCPGILPHSGGQFGPEGLRFRGPSIPALDSGIEKQNRRSCCGDPPSPSPAFRRGTFPYRRPGPRKDC